MTELWSGRCCSRGISSVVPAQRLDGHVREAPTFELINEPVHRGTNYFAVGAVGRCVPNVS